MSDEEKKDVVEETPKDEATEAAGPVAEDGESSSQAAGDVPILDTTRGRGGVVPGRDARSRAF